VDKRQIAWSLDLLGRLSLSQGKLAEADGRFAASVDGFDELGSYAAKSLVLSHQGECLLYQERLEEAAHCFDQCLEICQSLSEVHSPALIRSQNYLAEIAIYHGRFDEARRLLDQTFSGIRQSGYLWRDELSHFIAGQLALKDGRPDEVLHHWRESLLLQQSLREPLRIFTLLETVAAYLAATQQLLSAARLYGAIEQQRQKMDVAPLPLYQPQYQAGLSRITAELDPTSHSEARQAGQSLSLNQALLYALRCLE
jgi:tetratricopeptide (TPR) repeat protein